MDKDVVITNLDPPMIKGKNSIVCQKLGLSNVDVMTPLNQSMVKCENSIGSQLRESSCTDPQEETNNNQSTGVGLRLIAPKLPQEIEISSLSESIIFDIKKKVSKRDANKRETHRQIERRRRDKINTWILTLKELIPDSKETDSSNEPKYKANAADSKSEILMRACDYIKEIQQDLKSLRECLADHDDLRLNNQRLQFEIDQLKSSKHKILINKVIYNKRNGNTRQEK